MLHHVLRGETEFAQQHLHRRGRTEVVDAQHVAAINDMAAPALRGAHFHCQRSGDVRRQHDVVVALRFGVGTVLGAIDLHAARQAGARFALSPGMLPYPLDAADDNPLPLLPGTATATASEAMSLLERGYRHIKFFPAAQAGGHKLLEAWASPLPQIRFCPTGGISLTNAADFLALPNVLCVGGSWLTPADKLGASGCAAIELLAREAASL